MRIYKTYFQWKWLVAYKIKWQVSIKLIAWLDTYFRGKLNAYLHTCTVFLSLAHKDRLILKSVNQHHALLVVKWKAVHCYMKPLVHEQIAWVCWVGYWHTGKIYLLVSITKICPGHLESNASLWPFFLRSMRITVCSSPALDVRGDTEKETQNHTYDRNLQRCSLLSKSLTSHAHWNYG